MSDLLDDLEAMASTYATAPSMAEMPRRTLRDKGIEGPTAAHVIEEVHTPFNLAYLTFTTGSSAFQNIVGVTHSELAERGNVTRRVLEAIGAHSGDRMLVTYPPLVNVFSSGGLAAFGIGWFFLDRSSREAFIVKFCRERPAVLLGESSFIRASLQEAKRLGLRKRLPERCAILVAGTPLDLELLPVAESLGYQVHDLYGCQEFGWLTLDGVPVRNDITTIASPAGGAYRELVVGGLPMGDSFPVSETGHVCNAAGRIITYRRRRTHPEYEVIVRKTPVKAVDTIQRAARTILRIKGRVVKVAPDVETGSDTTALDLVPGIAMPEATPNKVTAQFVGPAATQMFDDLVRAQLELQETAKTDPVWTKTR